MDSFDKHLAAVRAGMVDGSNIRGIQKALNAAWRAERGYSISSTSPKWAEVPGCIRTLKKAIRNAQPRIAGDLDRSGRKLLQSPRYADRFKGSDARVIADLDRFELVAFGEFSPHSGLHHPAFRAVGRGGESFVFVNVPWQSGGNGPEILTGLEV